MSEAGFEAAVDKMRADGVPDRAIAVFEHYYRELEAGKTGTVAESDVSPLSAPIRLTDLRVDETMARTALDHTVVIKLNGGLGTSMGMAKAKSLLVVHGGLTFLDVIAGQIQHARRRYDARLPVVFMNSFRTRDDTLAVLSRYPDLEVDGLPLDFVQNREPKLLADDLTPVSWPADPELEWCPPGHGDLYTALETSGLLDRLLDAGVRRAFVSNVDNLGAVPDARVAGWFASSGAPYASEVVRRTSADRKGGHLVVRNRDHGLILRESAQTRPEDEAAFGDVSKHRFFHANNLWLDLGALRDRLRETAGVLGLPLIRNEKTVDPADPSSPKVVQIETAMGSAVEVFSGAQAIEVDRSRFLPVKTTNDLLALRSDAYDVGSDFAVALAAGRHDGPYVDLDPRYFKLVGDFDKRFPAGPPSLLAADALEVVGDWTFERGVVVRGRARLDDRESASRVVPAGSVLGDDLGP